MKLIDMSDYNRAAKAFWGLMVVAGSVLVGWSIKSCWHLSLTQGLQFASLLLLVAIASSYPIRIPSTNSSFTASDVFTFLACLILGVPAAVIVGVVDAFVSSKRTSKRPVSWIGGPAIVAVTVFLSGNTFYFVLQKYAHVALNPLGVAPVRLDQLLACLALLALTHYFINGFAISTIYALKTQRPILKFWRDSYLWTWWSFLASAIGAAVIYIAASQFGWLYAVLSVPIILMTFATYKIYFERITAKTREAEELSRLHLATVEALATAIDAKDQTTHCHVRRVQIYADGLGKLLRLSEAELAAMKAGALLHDIGKLAVPDQILNKPGMLTPAEFEKTKIHTIVGEEILKRVNFPYPVLPIVRHHHERWDGRGYPDGLRQEEIPITARIMSVVDCFDSVREDRPFREGMSSENAVALLRKGSGTHFDPRIVELFIQHLPKFEAEVDALGLADNIHTSTQSSLIAPAHEDGVAMHESATFTAYDKIRNAHREVYALYEIARTFGSSLEIENTLSSIVDKVGHIVPFDTCVVYLFDQSQGHARTALAVGMNAEAMRDRCFSFGEGATGFALANRQPVNRLHPSLDFAGTLEPMDCEYRSMAALPLVKDDLLLGALSVYSTTLKEYSDDQIRLLETVTHLASDALANAVNHARAESHAHTDALTGLPNARSLHVRFEEEVARAQRTGRPFQLIMLDLDDFKLVNDTFGHRLGDRMLREVAGLVQSQLREYDFLARYAGDEFVAIVPDVAAEHVEDLRERIERTVSNFSIEVRGQGRARVGVSVGWAVYGCDGETLDQLVMAADEAMYRAKSSHKAIIFAGPKPDLSVTESGIDHALEEVLNSLAIN
jgi:diguanylate cyclase (GGDEF)-like protein/putative nucleotidyltransferase with HDIG domain